MSRIYRALEKAEEEKRQEVKKEPSLKVFEEKVVLKKEAPTLKFPEEKIAKIEKTEGLGLPSKESHRKAILIDGDLRKPGIRLKQSQNGKGLSDYLSNRTPLTEILMNSQMENLRIIMAGPSTNKSSELIGSKRMEELLKSLSESGDNTYILIDSPPIISNTEPTF